MLVDAFVAMQKLGTVSTLLLFVVIICFQMKIASTKLLLPRKNSVVLKLVFRIKFAIFANVGK